MSANKAHDQPSDVTVEEGIVIVDGPDGVAYALTPEAARETGERLRTKGDEAAGGDAAEMEVVMLPPGERAPAEADCICLDLLGDGRVNLSGNILAGEESCTLISREPYASRDEAEAAGLAWAGEHQVSLLYVTTLPAA